MGLKPASIDILQDAFGDKLQRNIPLARYTAARLGGPADLFLEATSMEELVQAASLLWKSCIPFVILGSGSNILVSDAGVRAVVILNRARKIRFNQESNTVRVESGANLGVVAHKAAVRGFSGLEWAVGIPGTVGGAIVGNAGAHGCDMASLLLLAEILHPKRVGSKVLIEKTEWQLEKFQYAYRSSILKRQPGGAVVLEASLQLENSTQKAVQNKMDEFGEYRRRTQPPGASMGSMFKNPPGDFAGRLIEASGLKGARVGDAQISPKHANFFINLGAATSTDIYDLIKMVRRVVKEKFDILLELEIELFGEW